MRQIQVTEENMQELAVFSSFSEPQLLHISEPSPGIFIAESAKVVKRALEAGYEPLKLLVEDRLLKAAEKAGDTFAEAEDSDIARVSRILRKCTGVPLYTASYAVLEKVTSYHVTSGVLCAMRRKILPTVGELECFSEPEGYPVKDIGTEADPARDHKMARVVVLENVLNPTNVGAVFRSAAALGIDAVLLSKACADPLYRRAIRVSMGTVFQVPWTYLPDAPADPSDHGRKGADLSSLRHMGFHLCAMALSDHASSLDDPALKKHRRLAIILGNEGEGLNPATIAASDETVCIPMRHGVDSLNVAAASAVVFWELRRKDEADPFLMERRK